MIRLVTPGLCAVLLAATSGGCSDSSEDDAWLVTGQIEDSSPARNCADIEGVDEMSFGVIFDAIPPEPERVTVEVTGETAANEVVECVEDAGGTVTARRA